MPVIDTMHGIVLQSLAQNTECLTLFEEEEIRDYEQVNFTSCTPHKIHGDHSSGVQLDLGTSIA